MDSIRMMALNSIRHVTGRPIRSFHDRTQALNWLVAQQTPGVDELPMFGRTLKR